MSHFSFPLGQHLFCSASDTEALKICFEAKGPFYSCLGNSISAVNWRSFWAVAGSSSAQTTSFTETAQTIFNKTLEMCKCSWYSVYIHAYAFIWRKFSPGVSADLFCTCISLFPNDGARWEVLLWLLLYDEGGETLDQVAQRGGRGPILETLKARLDGALRNLV